MSYLFSVVDNVNQSVICVENSAVQRLETVHRHPIVSSLQDDTDTRTISAQRLDPIYTVTWIASYDYRQTDRLTNKQTFGLSISLKQEAQLSLV